MKSDGMEFMIKNRFATSNYFESEYLDYKLAERKNRMQPITSINLSSPQGAVTYPLKYVKCEFIKISNKRRDLHIAINLFGKKIVATIKNFIHYIKNKVYEAKTTTGHTIKVSFN